MMFQPHGFTPMRMMGRQIIDEFTAQMNNDDLLPALPEIYFAGGSVTRDISSQDLVNYAKEKGKQALFFLQPEKTAANSLSPMPVRKTALLLWARAITHCPNFAKPF